MEKTKYTLQKRKAQPVEISTGIRTEAEAQVLRGLQVGDTIITGNTATSYSIACHSDNID